MDADQSKCLQGLFDQTLKTLQLFSSVPSHTFPTCFLASDTVLGLRRPARVSFALSRSRSSLPRSLSLTANCAHHRAPTDIPKTAKS